MSRLVKRWIGLAIFVIVLGVAFVNLGQWQLRRLDERQHTNATVIAHRDAPVKPFAQAFTAPIADGDQWQRVEATGTYDAEHTVIIRYRNLAGATGVEVVTPLRTADRTVLVDRGFVAAGAGGEAPSVAPAPTGQVTVIGYRWGRTAGRALGGTVGRSRAARAHARTAAALAARFAADGRLVDSRET